MIWRAIRYLLVATSIAGLIWFLYLLKTLAPPSGSERLVYAIPAFFILNIAYLLFGDDRKPPRLVGLLRLWLEAKEAELRRRAKENSN
jgi:hypothetical protein